MKKSLIFTLSIASLLLSGCSVFQPDIQQGNVIQPAKLALLKPGMDKSKVRYIMGDPLLTNPFRPDHWVYVYTMKKPGQPFQQEHVTLIFNGDQLAQIEKHLNPAIKAPEGDNPMAPEERGARRNDPATGVH